MLRVCFLQPWFALPDPAVEDALNESPVLRRFAGIDLGRAPVPMAAFPGEPVLHLSNDKHCSEQRDQFLSPSFLRPFTFIVIRRERKK